MLPDLYYRPDLGLLDHLQSINHLNAKVTYDAHQLNAAKKQLHRPQVFSVDRSTMDSLLIERVRLWADRREAQTYFLRCEKRTLVTSGSVPEAIDEIAETPALYQLWNSEIEVQQNDCSVAAGSKGCTSTVVLPFIVSSNAAWSSNCAPETNTSRRADHSPP